MYKFAYFLLPQEGDFLRRLRGGHSGNFTLPPVKREFFRKSPLYFLPLAWNSFFRDIKFQTNKTTLKNLLYTHFENLQS
jgi:hypothetical protein